MSNPFVLFGRDHLIVLALAAVTRRNETERRAVDYGFAAFLIATWILWFYVIFDNGWQSAQTLLPMNLCDWATIAAIVTLIRPNQKSYELASGPSPERCRQSCRQICNMTSPICALWCSSPSRAA